MQAMYRDIMGWRQGVLPADTAMWICAFSINQNADIQGELGTSVLESPFAAVLGNVQQLVVLFNLSTDLYTRVWCVLEGFIAESRLKGDQQLDSLPGKQSLWHVYAADFARFDADADGFLTKPEVLQLLRYQLEREPTERELADYFEQVDMNHDQRISLEEYVSSI